jgi:2-methylisocitrate lyase-like PEP mutase family enzyme
MDPSAQPAATSAVYAQCLKALHKPGKPIVFTNIYDLSSLYAILSLNNNASSPSKPVVAIATASYAIAESLGIRDEDLTFEQHFAALKPISKHVHAAGLPLSIDLQDGYGTRLEESIAAAIDLGAAGANIEDSFPDRGFARGIEGSLRSTEEQAQRIRTALRVAAELGVPDFVVNARTDVMRLQPQPDNALQEAVERGRAYLNAGATTVFVWGGGSGCGVGRKDVERLVDEFSDKPDGLTVSQLAAIGVARISVGPSLWTAATSKIKSTATRILAGGRLYEA